MAQIMRRLDVMKERCAREGYGLPTQRRRKAVHTGRLQDDEDEDAYQDEEGHQEFEEHEP